MLRVLVGGFTFGSAGLLVFAGCAKLTDLVRGREVADELRSLMGQAPGSWRLLLFAASSWEIFLGLLVLFGVLWIFSAVALVLSGSLFLALLVVMRGRGLSGCGCLGSKLSADEEARWSGLVRASWLLGTGLVVMTPARASDLLVPSANELGSLVVGLFAVTFLTGFTWVRSRCQARLLPRSRAALLGRLQVSTAYQALVERFGPLELLSDGGRGLGCSQSLSLRDPQLNVVQVRVEWHGRRPASLWAALVSQASPEVALDTTEVERLLSSDTVVDPSLS
jgi:uncharacterized membrane protein YphA (DoxX/SURF4 family)